MKLFLWDGIEEGNIVVIAENIEEARKKAILNFENFLKNDDVFQEVIKEGKLTEKDVENIHNEESKEFYQNISFEPCIYDDSIIIGSEGIVLNAI